MGTIIDIIINILQYGSAIGGYYLHGSTIGGYCFMKTSLQIDSGLQDNLRTIGV